MLPQASTLRSDYAHLRSQPYGEVYLEVVGHEVGKASDGFAADYKGQYQVDSLLVIRHLGPDDCPGKKVTLLPNKRLKLAARVGY